MTAACGKQAYICICMEIPAACFPYVLIPQGTRCGRIIIIYHYSLNPSGVKAKDKNRRYWLFDYLQIQNTDMRRSEDINMRRVYLCNAPDAS